MTNKHIAFLESLNTDQRKALRDLLTELTELLEGEDDVEGFSSLLSSGGGSVGEIGNMDLATVVSNNRRAVLALKIMTEHVERQTQVVQKITS